MVKLKARQSTYRKRLLVTALAAAVAVPAYWMHGLAPAHANSAPAHTLIDPDRSPRPGSFADLVEAVAPAVVNISTTGTERRPEYAFREFSLPPGSPFEEFFKRYFDEEMPGRGGTPAERETRAVGSGFIVSPDGYVVTNYHVVRNADKISVVIHDGGTYPATLKGVDDKTDLALLKIDAGDSLPYVEFGDSDTVRVGDWVVAIGNPFGLGGTATTGIVSARGRDIQSGPLDDFLQIDAPINQGNSGGPLFDATGKVVGVNTAIYSPNGGNVGIGFAIPASLAKNVVDQLKENGRIDRGWLGVQIQGVTKEIAEGLGMDEARGAVVADVVADSPAARAGLRPGDVILSFNGSPIKQLRDLPRLVADTAQGSSAKLQIWREGGEHKLDVKVGASPEVVDLAQTAPTAAGEKPKLGLTLGELNGDTRRRYGVADGSTGVVVLNVDPDGPAAEAGVRPGDVITMVGTKNVSHPQEVVAAVEHGGKRDTVVLLVIRDGTRRFVAVKTA